MGVYGSWPPTYRWRPSTRVVAWRSDVIVAPTADPITVYALKTQARITTTDEDDFLVTCIQQATDQVERDSGTALLTQTRDVYLSAPPSLYEAFTLPYPPIQSITSVSSVALDGTETVVDSATYLVLGGRMSLGDAALWPVGLRALWPFRVRVVCGYASPAAIPPLLIRAVTILAAHFAQHGRDLVTDANLSVMPQSYNDAIARVTPMVLI